MYFYGKTSQSRRDTCHPDLVRILDESIKEIDFSILCGVRLQEAQQAAFKAGKSQVQWPESMHNVDPLHPRCPGYPDKSLAFDAAEWHGEIPGGIDWGNKQEMWDNAKIILKTAKDLKWLGAITHDIRWGGDWDGDDIPVFMDQDETFWDAVHFELILNPSRAIS